MCSHTYTSLECDGAFRFCIECDTEEKIKDLYEHVARGVESLGRGEGGSAVPFTFPFLSLSLHSHRSLD